MFNSLLCLILYFTFLSRGLRVFIEYLPVIRNIFFQATVKDIVDQTNIGLRLLFELFSPLVVTDLFGSSILATLPSSNAIFYTIRIFIAVIANLTFVLRLSVVGALTMIKYTETVISIRYHDLNSALRGALYLFAYLGILVSCVLNPFTQTILGRLMAF